MAQDTNRNELMAAVEMLKEKLKARPDETISKVMTAEEWERIRVLMRKDALQRVERVLMVAEKQRQTIQKGRPLSEGVFGVDWLRILGAVHRISEMVAEAVEKGDRMAMMDALQDGAVALIHINCDSMLWMIPNEMPETEQLLGRQVRRALAEAMAMQERERFRR